MKTSIAVKHYGSKIAIAKELGITRQAVSKWGDVIPSGAARELERRTKGAIKIQPDLYKLGAAK